jgi:hypothetical protein
MDTNATLTLDASQPATSSKMLWTGRIIGGLIVLFMIFDGVTKVMKIAPVVQAMQQGGFAASLAPVIGIIALVCTLLYAIPRTSVLGAILLTAYLGGATVTNLRVGQPVYFSIVFGVLAWLALYCRDARIRALLPLT